MQTKNTNTTDKHIKATSMADGMVCALLDMAPIPAILFDADANPIYCNQSAAAMCKMSDRQEYMDNFYALMPFSQPNGQNSKDVLRQIVEQTLLAGNNIRRFTYQTADGAPVLTDIVSSCLDLGGKQFAIVYSSAFHSSKNENHDLEADIRTSLILDSSPLACFIIDRDFNVLDCNAEAIKFLGLSQKEDALGRFFSIFPESGPVKGADVDIKSAILKALATGGYRFEFKCQNKDNTIKPCEITLSRTYYKKDHTVAVYIRDLGEMKAVIADIKRAEIAERESHAKSRFLAQMSHEIRTPLSAILGTTEIQLLGCEHTPEAEEAFMQIYTSSNLLLSIINDLLDMSKVAAEKMTVISERYEMVSLIVDTVQLNLMYIGDKNISFALYADPEIPYDLIGDERCTKQILNNILSNAFKYTKEGTVTLSIAPKKTDDPEKVVVVYKIQDTGTGMTEEQVKSIFEEEYLRFNESENRNIQGTGLGMSITKRMVDLMDGEIYVESAPGEGSTFTVLIPQKKCGDQVLGDEASKKLENLELSQRSLSKMRKFTREPMPYGRVLVVDDVETNLHVAKGLLLPYGLEVDLCGSGEEAVEKVKGGEIYDIIFMDHMMPGMDGVDATKLIREFGYNNPIVAFTANVLAGQTDIFAENGFSGLLVKPVDVHQLDEHLVRFIRDKKPTEVVESANIKSTKTDEKSDKRAELMEFFLRDAIKAANALESIMEDNLFDAKDVKLYTIRAHGLKSGLANIGELSLSKQAHTLEQAGQVGDLETIRHKTPDFLTRLQKLIKKNTPEEEPDTKDEQGESHLAVDYPPYLKQGLAVIREACENFDMFTAQKALEELNENSSDKNIKALLNKIRDYLLHSKFEQAVKFVEDLL